MALDQLQRQVVGGFVEQRQILTSEGTSLVSVKEDPKTSAACRG